MTSAKKGLHLPLGRGVFETKSKNGRSRLRKPFISRVFCAKRGVETMVSDMVLEGARPWGREDPETVMTLGLAGAFSALAFRLCLKRVLLLIKTYPISAPKSRSPL